MCCDTPLFLEENLSFFPQCVLENIMMTSLLADKLVIVEIKMKMNFMNEIINPPCNSLLVTFFESICGVCPKTVSSSLRRLIRLQPVQAAVSSSPVVVPEENVAGERSEESPVGGPGGPIEVGCVCETEASTEVDVEDEDEDVDVVGGVDEVGVSGYESEGFTLSEFLHRKRLEKRVSEGVIDIAPIPQYEFSKIQQLPLALLLEFFCWPVNEFFRASYTARAGT